MLLLKRRIIIGLISIFLILICYAVIPKMVYADGENWLTDWDFRKSHTIENSTGAGTNYQISIVAHYGSGSDSGKDVYLDSNCKTDFGDIRFTDNDGNTELDYWIEEKTDSDNAIFWVEVKDDLDSSDVTIYIYYGNDAVSTTSNGYNTFLEFSNFNDGTLDGFINVYGVATNPSTFLRAQDSGGTTAYNGESYTNYSVISKVRTELPYSLQEMGILGRWLNHVSPEKDSYLFRIYDSNTWQLLENDGGSWTVLDSGVGTYSENVWYKTELAMSGTTIKGFINETEVTSVTNAVNSVGYGGIRGFGQRQDWDDWRIRKYITPEPVNGDWGNIEGLIYITFKLNNSDMGKFYVDNIDTVNETQTMYFSNTNISLSGITTNSSYKWLNFTWVGGNSTENTYVYNVSENNTIWCYFNETGIDEGYFVLGFVIAGCALLFMIIVIKGKRRE